MNDFYEDFHTYIIKEALRVHSVFPAYWGNDILDTALFHNMKSLFKEMSYDVTALENYYREKSVLKDPKNVFITVVKEIVYFYGYGPEQCNAIALWYFILVKMSEYDTRVGIDELTDLSGMMECYLNTGEIDYEHSWITK